MTTKKTTHFHKITRRKTLDQRVIKKMIIIRCKIHSDTIQYNTIRYNFLPFQQQMTYKKKKKTFKNLRLTLPGQGAVLLQTLDSLKGPLQCVPYGETHVLVRTCDPCPHVTEQELHWDHSSAPDSPVWEKGDTS